MTISMYIHTRTHHRPVSERTALTHTPLNTPNHTPQLRLPHPQARARNGRVGPQQAPHGRARRGRRLAPRHSAGPCFFVVICVYVCIYLAGTTDLAPTTDQNSWSPPSARQRWTASATRPTARSVRVHDARLIVEPPPLADTQTRIHIHTGAEQRHGGGGGGVGPSLLRGAPALGGSRQGLLLGACLWDERIK